MRTLLLSEKLLIILKIININSLVIIIIFPLKKKKTSGYFSVRFTTFHFCRVTKFQIKDEQFFLLSQLKMLDLRHTHTHAHTLKKFQ